MLVVAERWMLHWTHRRLKWVFWFLSVGFIFFFLLDLWNTRKKTAICYIDFFSDRLNTHQQISLSQQAVECIFQQFEDLFVPLIAAVMNENIPSAGLEDESTLVASWNTSSARSYSSVTAGRDDTSCFDFFLSHSSSLSDFNLIYLCSFYFIF